MRRFVCIVSVVLFSFCLSPAQEEETYDNGYRGLKNSYLYDFNSSGFGARSRAMGGVFMALSNDGFGSFLNPAGMIFTDKSIMSLELINSQDKFNDLYLARLNTELGEPIIYYLEIQGKHTKLIQASAVAPFIYFDRDWWFGGGFRTVYDLHLEYEVPVYADSKDTYTIHKGIDALNMALATSPIPNIGVGVNMNYYVRGYESREYVAIIWEDPLSELGDYNEKDKSNFSGVNFDIGAIAEFDIIKAGLVVRTGYTLTQKAIFSRGFIDVYGDELNIIDRITVKNRFPMTYGGGVAITPVENFALAAEIDIKPYSKVKMDIDNEALHWTDFSDNDTLPAPAYDPEWEDLNQYRVGAEYIFDAGFAEIPLRAGYHNLPCLTRYYKSATFSIVTEDTISYYDRTDFEKGDQINTNIFSFGLGLKLDKIWFDVAYEFGSSERDVALTIEDRTWNDPLKYKYSRLYFSMGMLF